MWWPTESRAGLNKSSLKNHDLFGCEVSGAVSAFEVGVSGEAGAVDVEDFAAFLGGDAAVGDGFFGEGAEFCDEFLGVVFDVGEDVGDGVSFDFVGVDGFAFFEVDADDVGVS